MLVRGRSLVDQASRRLSDMGVPHGVLMANHKSYNLSERIQIASVDTVRSRGSYPNADMLVIDEAHMAVSQSFKDLLEHYKETFILGVTATPWVKEGLSHLASDVVYPISISELMEQGHLVRPKYYVPNNFDASNIMVSQGDFAQQSSIEAIVRQKIHGDIVGNYLKNCRNGKSFLYVVNVKHAEMLAEAFDAVGVKSTVITAKTDLKERTSLINDYNLVISISTLTTGVDVPELQNIILARPTASKNLYIQMLGRGTRPYAGKEFFRVFDHVGNIQRHGFIESESKFDLSFKEKAIKAKNKNGDAPFKICDDCKACCHTSVKTCQECGYQFPQKKAFFEYKNDDGDLVEFDLNDKDKLRAMFEKDCASLITSAWLRGHKETSIYYRLKEKYGETIFFQHLRYYNEAKNEYARWDQQGADDRGRRKGYLRFGF